jgi:nitroimidazol reductase NimA-like FMN-containing flavoprotein (pyridoxamine 5'-phosphate oxidase superfamily)
MLGTLSSKEVDVMLCSEVIGRIGCYSRGRIFVVPINYAYDGGYIYAHSKEGLKIEMMRENNEVCFEIDARDVNGNWKSVIAWGTYEELKTVKSQRAAMKIFLKQMVRLIPAYKAMPSHGIAKGAGKDKDPFKSIVFRISIREKSGRFEDK